MKQQALIQWIDSAVGGLGSMPLQFSALVKFQGWQSETWRLMTEILSSFDQHANLYRGEIWFLADNAPVEVLRPGAQFALFEGTKIIAVGRCIT